MTHHSRLSRSAFLGSAAVAAVSAALPSRVDAQAPAAPAGAPHNVLVLSGGIAHGAYEAGVIEGLGAAPYDVVCGTSIGALNGALFAAGRSNESSRLWATIGRSVVLDIKAPYRHIAESFAGVGTRAFEAIRLALEATGGTLQGVMRSEPVLAILRSVLVDETHNAVVPFRIPLFWATSDLTSGCAAYYYRMPEGLGSTRTVMASATASRFVSAATSIGLQARQAPSDPGRFVEALRASAAIPGVFDPSYVADVVGNPYAGDVLVDGGIMNNTPFALVHAALGEGPLNVDAVLLGMPSATHDFAQTKNVLGIVLACYDLMRQKLMNDAVRALSRDAASTRALNAARASIQASFDSLQADRTSTRSGLSTDSRLDTMHRALDQIDSIIGKPAKGDVTIRFRSPSRPLAGSSFDFHDQDSIDFNYRMGRDDIAGGAGWIPYQIPDDLCQLTGVMRR